MLQAFEILHGGFAQARQAGSKPILFRQSQEVKKFGSPYPKKCSCCFNYDLAASLDASFIRFLQTGVAI